ncbi:MAG: hypothetical protein ISQ95_02190 [Flavobacteriales bacterium]|nr:hypothetical protein [Flavobacteriales bacterium]
MSLVFFGIGFLLFSIYLIFLIWNIFYNGKKQKQENYPNLDTSNSDNIDLDGIGNQGRVPK